MNAQAPSKKCVLEIVRRDGTHEQPYALQVVADDRRWELAYLPANFEIRNTLEPRAVTSEACDAARTALAADDTVTYPSHVSAGHIRSVLRDLLAAYERLHILYRATCASYCREHEAASSQPPHPEHTALLAENEALRGALDAPRYGSARAIRECPKHEWPTDPPSPDGALCCHCGAVYQA